MMEVAQLLRPMVLTYSGLRSLVYSVESWPLLAMHRLVHGLNASPPPGYVQATIKSVRALLEEDARLIADGTFPIDVLAPENPVHHVRRLSALFTDAARVTWRRKVRSHRQFGRESQQWMQELPEYYQRNFHYQTDGYLSERSARLYEHQVEILFRGSANAMRRLVLPPMVRHFEGAKGKPLRLLELGCGTGTTTGFVSRTLPEARIVATDLSRPYLSVAKRRLSKATKVDFMHADAAKLPFQDQTFDGIYSVFLFHELPHEVRRQVFAEAYRCLKPGGIFSVVDSLQKNDVPDLNWGLEQFPKDFHEPFYRNYTLHPLEDLMSASGFFQVQSNFGFYSKSVSGVR